MLVTLIIIKVYFSFLVVTKLSGERTMQGDSTAVLLYALGSLLSLDAVLTQNTKHAACADNFSCSSKLQERTIWWHKIV